MSRFSRWSSEDMKPAPPTLPCVPLQPTALKDKATVSTFVDSTFLPTVTTATSTQTFGEKLSKHPIKNDAIFSKAVGNNLKPEKSTCSLRKLSTSILASTDNAFCHYQSIGEIPVGNKTKLAPICEVQCCYSTKDSVEENKLNSELISTKTVATCSPESLASAKLIYIQNVSKNDNKAAKSEHSNLLNPENPEILTGKLKQNLNAADSLSKSIHFDHGLLTSFDNASIKSRKSASENPSATPQIGCLSKILNNTPADYALSRLQPSVPKQMNKISLNLKSNISSGRHIFLPGNMPHQTNKVNNIVYKVGNSSFDEDDTEVEDFLSPSDRWASQPKSYRGPRKDLLALNRRMVKRVASVHYPDTTTDGETSGMGSSLDELVESSTESASESSCSCAVDSTLQNLPCQFRTHANKSESSENKTIREISLSSLSSLKDFPLTQESLGNKPQHCSSINLDMSHSTQDERSSLLFIPLPLSCQEPQASKSDDFQVNPCHSASSLRNKSRSAISRSALASCSADVGDGNKCFTDSSSALPKCPPVKRRGGWPKGRKRKPEIPGAKPPKAPQTAYVLFLADRRKFYDPRKYSFGEITKLVAAEWNCLAQPQRDVYERRCEQEKNRYRNELQAYRQSHDFQLIMRKKRLKRALSGRNPEDSSDCTDGPEDDAPEELYCSKCDKLFSSLHNKRLHLYGRPHNRAQPVRKARNAAPSCGADYNTDNTDYNTDNTDYDEASTASLHHSMVPHRSSSTTSPSTSPFPLTASSPGTSVPATSASEDDELPVSSARREQLHAPNYGESCVASIAEEANDGDMEDEATEATGRPSVAALRAQLIEREQEIKRLHLAMQESRAQRAILLQTLEKERMKRVERSAALQDGASSDPQYGKSSSQLPSCSSSLAPKFVEPQNILTDGVGRNCPLDATLSDAASAPTRAKASRAAKDNLATLVDVAHAKKYEGQGGSENRVLCENYIKLVENPFLQNQKAELSLKSMEKINTNVPKTNYVLASLPDGVNTTQTMFLNDDIDGSHADAFLPTALEASTSGSTEQREAFVRECHNKQMFSNVNDFPSDRSKAQPISSMLSYATLVLDQSIDCGTSASFSLNKSQTVAACNQSNALPSLAPLLDHDYTKNVSSSLNFSSGLSCLSNTANIFDLTSDTSVMRQESECDHLNTAGPSTVPQDITSPYQSIGTNELIHSTHEHDTVRVIEEISVDSAQSYGNSFDLNLSNLDQEANPYLSSINLNEYNAIAPLSSVCTIVKDRTDPCQSSPCILTHTMPMKKIQNTFRYEKDSLHSVFLNAARNKSLCDVIDVTDTEDSCSDSVGTNETFNALSLGDSLLEDGSLRAEYTIHSSSNSNERPCGLFEHDFPLSYDNDLMDLNELLDRCLHDTNITEHTDEALNSFASPICPNSDLASQCSRAVVNTSERTSLSVYPDNHPRERKFSLDVASSQGNIPATQDRRSEPLTCASNDMQGELC